MKICDKHGNPIDGGEITPELEAQAQGKAREFQVGLMGTRKVLNADELASLISPGVRFEQEFKFPDKSAFFFTINGVLNGKKIEGALFAAECILVWAPNVLDAKDLAQRGIRATVEILHEEYGSRESRETRDLIQQGVNGPDIGGRRMGRGAPMGLPQRKKMEAMVAHIYGGKPFVW